MSIRPPRSSSTPARRLPHILAALGLAAVSSGCALLRGPTVQPTRFYVLDAALEPRSAGPPLSIGLGPVSLPTYLDRPEMVDRIGENQLTFDEFNRWSEPLKDNFVRVLATDLDRLLDLERLVSYPWYSSTPIDYAVSIVVLRFEPQPEGDVLLHARWTIGDGRGHTAVNRESSLRHPGGSPADRAAAMTTLTGELAADIAAALRGLKP
jgi:hypothetical protein